MLDGATMALLGGTVALSLTLGLLVVAGSRRGALLLWPLCTALALLTCWRLLQH